MSYPNKSTSGLGYSLIDDRPAKTSPFSLDLPSYTPSAPTYSSGVIPITSSSSNISNLLKNSPVNTISNYANSSGQLVDPQTMDMDGPTIPDVGSTPPTSPGEKSFFDDIFSDKYKMGNIAGLASSLVSLAAAPAMLKNARLQNDALQFNIDTAKQEQGQRTKNRAGFNSFKG